MSSAVRSITSKAEVEQILSVPVVPGNSVAVPPVGKVMTEFGVEDDGVGVGFVTLDPYKA